MELNMPPKKPNGAAPSGASRGLKTLIVESKGVEAFLGNEGHVLFKAASGKEAVIKARQFQPDFILLDSDLDDGAGLEVLSDLLIEQPGAAVILVSKKPDIAEAVEAIKRGAVDYLVYPVDLEKLKIAIDAQKSQF